MVQRSERAWVVVAASPTRRRNTSFLEILSSTSKVFSFTAQLLGHAEPLSQPCLFYCGILYQEPSRRAVLGKPLALEEALFWVSMLMLCCKCILFKSCTNYKLVLGAEDKNIFSQPVSVNNLWCYLEMWYSFHVAGNVCAVCERLQQPQSCLVVRLTNKAEKEFFCMLEMAKWIFITFFSTQLGRNLSLPQDFRRKDVYYTKHML